MPPKLRIRRALARLSAAGLLAGMAAGCASGTNQQVSRGMLAALRHRSQEASSLGFRLRGDEVDVQVHHTHGNQGSVQLPLKWRYGLPAMDTGINGQTVSLIVDTGSEGCLVLDADTAVKAKVATLKHAPDRFHLDGTLGREPAILGSAQHIQAGAWVINNLPCLIRTHQSVTGGAFRRRALALNIWGMALVLKSCSFLTLDYPAGTVTFGFESGFHPRKGSRVWQAPMRIRGGMPYVTLEHGGARWESLVDSGANGTLEIPRPVAERTGLMRNARMVVGERVGVGTSGAGSAVPLVKAYVPALKGLGPTLHEVPAYVVDAGPKIGSGLLRLFRVTLDFRRNVIWLEQRASSSR